MKNLLKKMPKSKKILAIIIFVLLLLLSIIPIRIIYSNNSIIGTWTTDEVTVYKFNKDKTGALIVPLSKYEFTYKIEGKKIYIDFKNEKSTDSDYEFSVKNNKLILKGINKTIGTYTFTRK